MIFKERFEQLIKEAVVEAHKVWGIDDSFRGTLSLKAGSKAFAHALIKAVEAESEVLLMGGKLQRVVELPLVEE
jgi:hypothetical protein